MVYRRLWIILASLNVIYIATYSEYKLLIQSAWLPFTLFIFIIEMIKIAQQLTTFNHDRCIFIEK